MKTVTLFVLFFSMLFDCCTEPSVNKKVFVKDSVHVNYDSLKAANDSIKKIYTLSEILVDFHQKKIESPKGYRHRNSIPFTVKDIVWQKNQMTIKCTGAVDGASYIGNVRISGDTMTLFYWPNQNEEMVLAFTSYEFTYTLKPIEHKKYLIKFIEPNWPDDRYSHTADR